MTPYYEEKGITIYHGDCREILPSLPKVDLVLTDPPYGIGLRNGDVDGHRSSRWATVKGDDSTESGDCLVRWAEGLSLPLIVFASPWRPWRIGMEVSHCSGRHSIAYLRQTVIANNETDHRLWEQRRSDPRSVYGQRHNIASSERFRPQGNRH
jgi:hypothetical protein